MNKLSPWILIAAGLFSAGAMAQMDVDQADSLNFQDFHKDKKEAIKVWKDGIGKRSETIKAYEQGTPATAANESPATASTATTSPATTSTTAAKPAPANVSASTAGTKVTNSQPEGEAKAGQRYEIRERYTLSRSAKTPYSAFYVIEPLHKQAYQLCPRGWKKLAERSEPVEQDFYQYFELECL